MYLRKAVFGNIAIHHKEERAPYIKKVDTGNKGQRKTHHDIAKDKFAKECLLFAS